MNLKQLQFKEDGRNYYNRFLLGLQKAKLDIRDMFSLTIVRGFKNKPLKVANNYMLYGIA